MNERMSVHNTWIRHSVWGVDSCCVSFFCQSRCVSPRHGKPMFLSPCAVMSGGTVTVTARTHTQTHTQTHRDAHTQTHTDKHTHTHTRTDANTQMQTHRHTLTYTRIQTHN